MASLNDIKIKITLLIDEAKTQLQQFNNQLSNTGGNANLGGNQLSQEARKIKEANQQAKQSMDELGKSGLGLKSVIQSLAGAFSLFAMYAGAKELIQIADTMKRVDGMIKVATQSVEGHSVAYKGLLDISMRTGTSFEANAMLFSRLNPPMVQMGGTAKNTLAFTEMLSKAQVIFGADVQMTNSVIRQMSQAMASGVLRGDEFNSIMENGGRVSKALADGLGVNIGALRKMAEAGELTTDKVMKALLSQSDKINAEYAAMPATVSRAFQRVKNAFDQYIADVDKGKGVTEGLTNSFDSLASNITPVVEGIVTAGKILIAVWGVQAVQALVNYGVAQQAALVAKREMIAIEQAHGQALIMNAEMTVEQTTARRAAIQADLQATAQRLTLVNAEVAAAQAEVAQTAGTTAHGNAVYRLNVAMQEKAVLTGQMSALGQQYSAITAQQTIAETELTAAQQAGNASLLAKAKALGLVGTAMAALNVAMAAFVGYSIGQYLNGFKEVRNAATEVIAVLHKLVETHILAARLIKAGFTGNSISKVIDDYKAAIQAIDDTKNSAIAYNDSLENAGKTSESYADTQLNLKDAATIFNEKMREQTDKFNSGKISLDEYTASLARLHDEFKNATASEFTKELDKIQARIDKAKLSPVEFYEKELRNKGITDQGQIDQLTTKFNEAQAAEQASKGESAGSGKFDDKLAKAAKKYGFDFNAVNAKFLEVGQKYGIDPELLKAQAYQESKFNPTIGSKAGAVGFSQFMPDTAKRFGLADRTDPLASIEAQGKYMSFLLKKFGGREDLALAGYNAGENRKSLEAGFVPNIKETKDYVKTILGSYDSDSAAQFERQAKTQENQQHANFDLEKAPIDLNKDKSQFEAKNAIDDLKRLKDAGKIGIKDYYEELSKQQEKSIQASIKALQEKMAVAQKEYEANKLNAAPEELPKIEADFKINQEKVSQELQQLQEELNRVKPVNLAEAAKEELAEQRKVAEEEINIKEQADNALLEMAQNDAQQMLELGQLSNEQFLEKQREFENKRYQIALQAAQARRALLDDNDTTGKAKALAKETELGQNHAKALKDINHKVALDSKETFTSVFAPIKSAFSSTVSGIIQGTTTVKEGMRNMAQSMVLSFANAMTNMAIDAAAQWAWELMGFGAKETAKVGLKTTSETAQTAATVGGIAARQTAEQAGHSVGMMQMIGSSLATIGTKAAEAAASTYSSVSAIPYVGWLLAPPAAAAAFVAVMGYQSMVSMFSSAGGDWDVSHDRVNLVHKNETILPAHIAAPMRDFFTNNPMNYGLPEQAMMFNGGNAQLANTAASMFFTQQSILMDMQRNQAKTARGSGTVVVNGQGGDWVHKDDVAKLAIKMNRNFKMA